MQAEKVPIYLPIEVLPLSKHSAIKFKESESALAYKFFHQILPIHIHHLYVQFSTIPSQVAQ